jgi:hypothetical protein
VLARSAACALLSGAALAGGAAPAHAFGDYYGKASNRYGETRFTIRGASVATLTLSRTVGATAARRRFTLACRVEDGRYRPVLSVVPTTNRRRLSGTTELDVDPFRCRITRGSTVIATMTARDL